MKLLLLLFFFLSGACGLVYEVVWTKLFSLSMGGTTYAISTVLAAFMGGLALGSRFGGKWIDRRGNPLLTYGILEGAIGLYCIAVPWLVGLIPSILGPFYDKYYVDNLFLFGLLRFILSAVILLVPTVLMGASLPVLARYYASDKARFGWEVGRLYALNTLGAGLGCFSAGFFLLPLLGQRWAIYTAAFVNIGIFLIVVACWAAFGRHKKSESTADKKPKAGGDEKSSAKPGFEWSRTVLWAALAVYAANGFAGMAYQVAWTRALTLSIGSSAYSFTIIVTIFIFGLAIGSGAGARLTDRFRNPAAVMAWVEILVGFSAIWVMWGLGQLPKWMLPIIARFSNDWNALVITEFVIVGLLLLLPTVLMGAVFPLAVKTVGMCRRGVGEPVGLAYGINTAGAIAGSLMAGFLLIPLIGLQDTIAAANIVNWVAGAILLGAVASGGAIRRWAKTAVPVVLGILVTVWMPPWDAAIMSSGPIVYAKFFTKMGDITSDRQRIIFYRDGVDTTVAVIKKGPESVFLRVNGKTDASTDFSDMITQVLSAHIPMLVHPDPKKVCIVGLASGVTLGSVTRHPVESVDVIELSTAVVEAAFYFEKWNHGALNDPRVKIIVGDGRNHLLMTRKKYDVVISEPSNPWIAGEAALFTRQYFELVKNSLNPGGVFCCWFQGYEISPEELRMVMRTFQAVFEESTLWETLNTRDYMMVGSIAPIRFDSRTLEARMRRAKTAEDMARVEMAAAAELMGKFIMGSRRFKMAAGKGEYHEDDRLQLQYSMPRHFNYLHNFYPELYNKIIFLKEHPRAIIGSDAKKWPDEFAAALERETSARDAIQFTVYHWNLGHEKETLNFLQEAVRLSPRKKFYRSIIEGIYNDFGERLIEAGDFGEVLPFLELAVRIVPDNPALRDRLGSIYLLLGDRDSAGKQFGKALELNNRDHFALYNLGFIEFEAGNRDNASEKFRRAIEAKPDFAPPYNGMGIIAFQERRLPDAEKNFKKAIELDPNYVDAYVNLGKVLIQHGNDKKRKEGLHYLKKALSLNPSFAGNDNFMRLLEQEGG